MEFTLKELGEGWGTHFEIEFYDVGHLYNLAHQVLKMRRILDELSLDVASPDEAREMLRLKGSANVNF